MTHGRRKNSCYQRQGKSTKHNVYGQVWVKLRAVWKPLRNK